MNKNITDILNTIENQLNNNLSPSEEHIQELINFVASYNLDEFNMDELLCGHENQSINDRYQFTCLDCGEELGR